MVLQSDQRRNARARDRRIWALVERQHGVVAHRQLLELGLERSSITWRVKSGRLHAVRRGVYAVGRPELSRHGQWMAAVLACGTGAVLSHGSAAALWGFGSEPRGLVEASLPTDRRCRRPGIRAHRRAALRPGDLTEHEGIPVTSPVRTLIDQATRLSPAQLEAHLAAGLWPLRFSHWQVAHEPAHVRKMLRLAAERARLQQEASRLVT